MKKIDSKTDPNAPGTWLETEKHRMRRCFLDQRTQTVHDHLFDCTGLRLDPAAARAFLLMGYVPGTGTLFDSVECLAGGRSLVRREVWHEQGRFQFRRRPELSRATNRELQSRGMALLRTAARQALGSSREIVIPLSGGLDSRTLLGLALELLSPSCIRTYTYGVPGSFDYELGNRLAREAGTRHTTIILRPEPPPIDDLIAIAKRTDANTNLFPPIVWLEVERTMGSDAEVWTGYTGDGLGGSFFMPARPCSKMESARHLVELESRLYVWARAADADESDALRLIQTSTKYDQVLSQDEAVWFENHPERYTAHHIFLDGFRYQAPFMDDAFAEFMLNQPPARRRGKQFFNDLVSAAFPRLYRVPTRNYGRRLDPRVSHRTVGHAAWQAREVGTKVAWRVLGALATHPHLTYLDYNRAIREQPAFQALVRDLVSSLAERHVVDRTRADQLLTRHLGGERLAETLMLLGSLEIALQTADAIHRG